MGTYFMDMIIALALFILSAFVLVKISTLVVPASKAAHAAARSWAAYIICYILMYHGADLARLPHIAFVVALADMITDGFSTGHSIFIWMVTLVYAVWVLFFKTSKTIHYMDQDETEVAMYLLRSEEL